MQHSSPNKYEISYTEEIVSNFSARTFQHGKYLVGGKGRDT